MTAAIGRPTIGRPAKETPDVVLGGYVALAVIAAIEALLLGVVLLIKLRRRMRGQDGTKDQGPKS